MPPILSFPHPRQTFIFGSSFVQSEPSGSRPISMEYFTNSWKPIGIALNADTFQHTEDGSVLSPYLFVKDSHFSIMRFSRAAVNGLSIRIVLVRRFLMEWTGLPGLTEATTATPAL